MYHNDTAFWGGCTLGLKVIDSTFASCIIEEALDIAGISDNPLRG
jgi:hypothetical protein